MSTTGRRFLRFAIFGLYLTLFPYHPRLRSPNELSRLWQARSLVDDGTVDINRALRIYGHVGDLSVKDGRYYPSKAPLLSFAAAPIYWALKAFAGGRSPVHEIAQVYWSRLFLLILPTLAALVLLRKFLGAFLPDWISEVLVAVYAVGTLAFSYSLLFMSHQTAAVLLFFALYALWRTLEGRWGLLGYLATGAAAGAAIAAEYTAALGILGLGGFAVVKLWRGTGSARSFTLSLGKAAGLLAIGAAPALGFLLWYHSTCFGHPFDTGYKYLADAAYQPWHTGGFLGIKLPDLKALGLSLFSPLRGLLTLSPVLLLTAPGLVAMWKVSQLRPLFWMTALLVLAYGYFTSSFSYESWGWTTGPRHLTPLVPFLLLPIGYALKRASENLQRPWLFGIYGGLSLMSVSTTALVTFVNYIPDTAHGALFGLALPLQAAGYLPPTIFSLVGVANPWAGMVALALLLALLGCLAHVWLSGAPKGRTIPAWAAAITWIAVLGAIYLVAPGNTEGDLGAVAHLKQAWLAPPGVHLRLWQ